MRRRNWYVLTNSIVLGWLLAAGVAVFLHALLERGSWLLLHLTLLGAASAAILIWSQHFADAILRRPAPGGRMGLLARLGTHSLGVIGVVIGVLAESPGMTMGASALVCVAVIVHMILLLRQLRSALPARFRGLVGYYLASGGCFVVGAGLGAWNAVGAPSGLADRFILAHATLQLLGWIGLSVAGTLTLLWPTVLGTRMPDSALQLTRWALPVLLGGLAVTVGGTVTDLPEVAGAGLLVWLAGFGMLAVAGVRAAIVRPPQSFAGWSIAAAILWLLGAVVVFAVGFLTSAHVEGARASFQAILPALAVGFALQVLLGSLSFLLPVVAGDFARATAAATLDRLAVYRVAVVNGGLAIALAPVPSAVRIMVSFVVFVVLAVFVQLAVQSLLRRRPSDDGDVEDAPSKGVTSKGVELKRVPGARRRGGRSLALAAGTLALAVAAGVALDPAAAGLLFRPSVNVTATGETTSVSVSVEGMRFVPDRIDLPAGNRLIIEFRNTGDDLHQLVLANGARSKSIGPESVSEFDAGVIGENLDGWCPIGVHRQLRMELTVVVSHAGGSVAHPEYDLTAEPNEGFVAREAALAPSDTSEHEITLTVGDTIADVAPGVRQNLWTYNGLAPGPALRGRVGDRFVVTLVNEGSMGHSIDFHAGAVAPDQPMRTIMPGESLVYAFTATRAGAWLYHCSTTPMSAHMANGMYGAVVIDPPDLDPVDREYLLVQGEYYLGAHSGPVDTDRLATGDPDLVTFNGYANQYRFDPLPASPGQRVRVWVVDAGPNRPSAFHVVGGQFNTVWKEGDYLLRQGGSSGVGGSQTLDIAPGQGGFVELVFPEPGRYSFVSHAMVDAERGAAGYFQVG